MFNVSSGNDTLHFWGVYLDCNVSGGEYDGSAAWNHATISPMSVFALEFGSDGIWIWTWIMKLPKNRTEFPCSKATNRHENMTDLLTADQTGKCTAG